MKKILIACEFSGVVRKAFEEIGWDAWSCDILPTEQPGQHFQCDVRDVLNKGWDLMIGHPPCTYLTNVGAVHFHGKNRDKRIQLMKEGADFFNLLKNAPINKICLENPVPIGLAKSLIGNYTQIIQPYEFNDDCIKRTCLWLKNLPKLKKTFLVPKVYRTSIVSSKTSIGGFRSAHERSRFSSGIAHAMADQWGNDSFLYNQHLPNPWLTPK